MPYKPKTPCRYPGCPELTTNTYCKFHTNDRPSAASRGYDSRWRKARKRFLKANPLCRYCEKEGRITPATVVDHIVPHRGDEKLFWDEGNWQPLCKRCHDRKTRTKDQYQEYSY
ncbi:Phage holin [Candidatus Syntrophocurvum alkaliphilum]|uniref:Putative HNH nuclease YajD n=1 Tax=Candidatus Syntrophocurvum alkaliphilum TaxID=2293317 RepID=A0A6I6DGJ7_9FIRM|nr:HNH endonuclease signature motif containing protein [Candidatus Syntrophocurvum alkaliphilum]QGT99520.1 Phage holin [Candidatus Syntrophocurvum alkaliphilum]